MLLKLSYISRKTLVDENKGMGVRGKNLWLSNAAHPAVLGGGIVGGFGASELINHVLPEAARETVGKRFAAYAGKGLGAALGAGTGAVLVKAFKPKPEEKK